MHAFEWISRFFLPFIHFHIQKNATSLTAALDCIRIKIERNTLQLGNKLVHIFEQFGR